MWTKLALIFHNILFNVIKPVLVSVISATTGLASTFWTWIISWLVNWGLVKVDNNVQQVAKVADQNNAAESAAKEYQKVVDDKTKSREDRQHAEETFLNS